jgi:hypothetical protein
MVGSLDNKGKKTFYVILLLIWKVRNELIFVGIKADPGVVSRVMTLAHMPCNHHAT